MSTPISAMHYKDKSPKETVNKLISTLDNSGLEIEEDWRDESYAGAYSLRVTFKRN